MLSGDEARLLDRLALEGAGRATIPSAAGVRRSRQRAFGLEFHEYRHYQAGDDPRSIDWNVEARLRQLMVRVSRAAGQMPVHILLDRSASMDVGSPSKFDCARKLAAVLCYVAVGRRDAAGITSFSDTLGHHAPPATGRAQLLRLMDLLQRLRASGPSAIDEALERYGSISRGPGLVVVLSDFFGVRKQLPGMRALMHRGFTPALVQVLAPEDVDPQIEDEAQLTDAENGSSPLAVHASAVAAYRDRLSAHETDLRAFCAANGSPWLRVQSNVPFARLLAGLQTAGLFQG